MNLQNLFEEDETDHWKALHDTGFYGAQGAGCIFLAKDTGRILIAHRSDAVEQPNTWGGWGGAINRGESPVEAVRREVVEEADYHDHYDLEPLYVFQKGTFKYHNFLVVVDHEFAPDLNWETQGFQWCEWGRWPQPLHFGLVALFNDAASVSKIQAHLDRADESVGAIGGSAMAYSPPMLTGVQRREAYDAGVEWGRQNPRASNFEAVTACPYAKNSGQQRIWLRGVAEA